MTPIFLRQNVDTNVKRSAYERFAGLAVTSVFYTMQGEGQYAGQPCVFIRLAGCNFGAKLDAGACAFCDTNFKLTEAQDMSVPDLVDKALSLLPQGAFLIVITGGEPFMQDKDKLKDLVTRLVSTSRSIVVQFETNGTQAQTMNYVMDSLWAQAEGNTIEGAMSVELVISPKAIYKANAYPDLVQHFSAHTKDAAVFKFVVDADPASPHHKVPDWATASDIPIYVSPMAVYAKAYQGEVSTVWTDLIDRERTAKNYAHAAQLVLDNPSVYSISIQMHLFLGIA